LRGKFEFCGFGVDVGKDENESDVAWDFKGQYRSMGKWRYP
jgi:hypothetical protein